MAKPSSIIGISFPFRKEDGQFPKLDTNQDVVQSNVLALFNCSLRERVMRPTVGANVGALVFESTGRLLEVRIQRAIINAVLQNEPRANIINITMATLNTLVTVDILYDVLGLQNTLSLSLKKAA